jgi:methyl-accepting chemotaxis protein-1 (serine sensor receptor)
MHNFKISTRLAILIGVLATLLLAIGSLGLVGINRSNDSLKTVYEDRVVALDQLGQVSYLMQRNRVLVMDMLQQPEAANIERRNKEFRDNLAVITKTWDAYMATYLTPQETELAKAFTSLRVPYLQEGLVGAADALLAGNIEAAQAINQKKIKGVAPATQEALQKLNQLQLDVAKQEYERAESGFQVMWMLSAGAIAAGLLFAAVFGTWIVRSISRQLGAEPGEAAGLAQAVAQGDLAIAIALKDGDRESLMAQLKAMQESLGQVVSNVRTSAENVSDASTEIAQGNADLASRTEQQASALEETAASMEELSSTVRQTADNAAQGNALAKSATDTATKGGEVVGRVVDTMKGINQSSQRIAEIIQVIDGIAFQTNILALNAAVEAARAGEQGRGFAVVATEVRNLAQRSAAAAKEIKTLINNSVEQVEQGTELVALAGNTMTEIVTSIRRVSDIMGEISAASAEQSAGVMQVTEAVTQMDQVTQQNAALVEESASAAESLKSQAQQLVQAVSLFKLSAAGGTPNRAIPATNPAARTNTTTSTTSAAWNGEERRSVHRAKNVTRPVFGQGKGKAKAVAPKVLAPKQKSTAQRTGTGDWESF